MAKRISSIDPALLAWTRRIREQLHGLAELSFEEHQTAALIREELGRMPFDGLVTDAAGTGLVAWLHGAGDGATVALRAEMDALPLTERTGLPYASVHPGRMHACGHDGHMAILLGLARWFCERRAQLCGTLKLIFQPGEEEGAGARRLVEHGVLRDPDVDAMLAVHARPQIAVGQIELAEVPNAYADGFDLQIRGAGCHGAYPHQGRDAVLIASHVVCNLQQVVSRRLPARKAAVVTLGMLEAGRARNVIADRACLRGTIRTRCPQVRSEAIAAVETTAVQTASALGGTASMDLQPGYPRVRCDPRLLGLVGRLGRELLDPHNVLEASEATMGADDFSYYLSEQGGVPGCLIRLGVETDQPLHSEAFDFGHRAIEPGMLVLANAALVIASGEVL